ncbi:hypothetical protein FHU12_5432 [Serratia marcescens]|uniref:Uncharacterized protein n=1 Tax=Serratia marcescens TaxID=615 RepID=A0AA46Q6Y0_SERMA|nr:hypothetical protein [Serratia marcescens]TQI77562.1 hypothetical protein FHU12_5432 [Serratia marcescens]
MNSIDLSHLSALQIKAAREFAALKFDIDMKARDCPENIPDDLHGPMRGGEYGPYFGMCFFNSIMPFMPRDSETQTPETLLIPVAQTLGCSWRWWPDRYLSKKDEEKIKSHIFSEYGISSTSYTCIPELGLFLPHEGKNRVNFCRHHNIDDIPARVYTHHYPKAERMAIYIVNIAGGKDFWSILDGRYIQKISHFSFAWPLLRAYGVTIKHQWPTELPPLKDILAHSETSKETEIFYEHVIDVEKIRIRLENNYIRTGMIDFPIRNKYVYPALFTVIFMIAMTAFDYSSGGLAESIFLAIGAFSAGSLFTLIAPVFWTKKRHLVNENRP